MSHASGDVLHPGAAQRHDLAAEVQPVVAMALQRGKGARRGAGDAHALERSAPEARGRPLRRRWPAVDPSGRSRRRAASHAVRRRERRGAPGLPRPSRWSPTRRLSPSRRRGCASPGRTLPRRSMWLHTDRADVPPRVATSPHPDAGAVMDRGEQRHLAAAHPDSVQLAAEVPVEDDERRAQPVGDGHGVGSASAPAGAPWAITASCSCQVIIEANYIYGSRLATRAV